MRRRMPDRSPISRRRFLLAAAAVPGLARAQAADYPARPVRIIVPALPGSASESIGRTLADYLTRKLGQPFVVEPVPGAAGIIGTDRVAKSAADGHTLLMGFNQLVTMNPSLYEKLPYDPQKDLAPIGLIQRGSFLLLVNRDLPADDVAGLVALARRQPGKLTYASSGNGSAPHLGMELFKRMAGVDLLHVPYRGGTGALADLMAGVVDVKIEPTISGLAAQRGGKVRLLGVTGARRAALLPDVPAVAETIPGYELAGWNAMWAPGGTPAAIVARLNKEINDALAAPDVRDRLLALGAVPEGSTPAYVADLTRRESAQWAAVIRRAGIKPD